MAAPVFYMAKPSYEPEQKEVRATTATVRDNPDSVTEHVPEYELMDVDGHAGAGLESAYKNSPITPSERGGPLPRQGYAEAVQDQDDERSRVGYAAAQEDAGNWGHGTLPVIFGIGPVVNTGGAFGPTYFEAAPNKVDVDSKMRPVRFQDNEDAFAAGAAMQDSREASAANPYASLFATE